MRINKVALHRFLGFQDFSVAFDSPYTVLVGPNNGGKTSILRGIEFAVAALKGVFGNGDEPSIQTHHQLNPWQAQLEPTSRLINARDSGYLFFGRTLEAGASITLDVAHPLGNSQLSVLCENNERGVVRLLHGGSQVSGTDPNWSSILRSIYHLNVEFVPPPGAVSAREREHTWPSLQEAMNEGRLGDVWRNRLHWANDGQAPELFARVAEVVRNMSQRQN